MRGIKKLIPVLLCLLLFVACSKDNSSDGVSSPGVVEANCVITLKESNHQGSNIYYTGIVENIGNLKAYNVSVHVKIYVVSLGWEVTLNDNVGSLNPGGIANYTTSSQNVSGGSSYRSSWVTWTE